MSDHRSGLRLQTQQGTTTLHFRYALTVLACKFMPKFLRIGIHQSNVSGYTSKAWCVRRVGSAVFLKWGAVEVQGAGDKRKVYWTLPPREKTVRCGTAQRA